MPLACVSIVKEGSRTRRRGNATEGVPYSRLLLRRIAPQLCQQQFQLALLRLRKVGEEALTGLVVAKCARAAPLAEEVFAEGRAELCEQCIAHRIVAREAVNLVQLQVGAAGE